MPYIRFQLGEIRTAKELGLNYTNRLVWAACPKCGKERWTKLRPSNDHLTLLCRSCASKRNWQSGSIKRWSVARENNPMWKGGRIKDGGGYIAVRLYPEDFFYSMARIKGNIRNGGYVQEHRLVMAKYLGRCLHSWEIVHHKNGIKDDNRQENLELSCRFDHIQAHGKGYQDGYVKGLIDGHTKAIKDLQSRVTLLEVENTLLKEQLAERGAISQE